MRLVSGETRGVRFSPHLKERRGERENVHALQVNKCETGERFPFPSFTVIYLSGSAISETRIVAINTHRRC